MGARPVLVSSHQSPLIAPAAPAVVWGRTSVMMRSAAATGVREAMMVSAMAVVRVMWRLLNECECC